MKVLSYLELACKTHHIYKDYETWLCLNVPYNWELSIRDFYSQPFKPELITELFEGWTLDMEENFYLFVDETDDSKIIDCDVDYYNGKGINYGGDMLNQITWYPRTLDDLITDCQRAGIELTWKTND